MYFMVNFTQGTLLHRVVRSSQSPIDLAFSSIFTLCNNYTLFDTEVKYLKLRNNQLFRTNHFTYSSKIIND